ncbi:MULTISPECIES: hypothetical protein [unclassified Microcoleus]|uniref:hypothetical protein n=1 Tax=unclassified Microcoleus TaxID=2642155 RepID=UPI0025E2CB33|nr:MULTISPECIES: hypothetical protein [unclassified Microcoleus]
MIDTLLCICEPSCCRPQLGLLKAEPQGVLYFTGRGAIARRRSTIAAQVGRFEIFHFSI